MPIVTGIRFKTSGRTYYFDPGKFELTAGDAVIVETARGSEFGNVVIAPKEIDEDKIVAPLKNVIRIATTKDYQRLKDNVQRQKDAFQKCEAMIEQHKLPMKLVDTECTFDRKKILFFFTSDGRVDFRNLVKDLASTFKTRIELRQIGVRDEAKLLGGLGSCGREVCCKSFLSDFRPVSIKMAKDQGISLNPSKISGLCGRLMCCLEYEHTFYKSIKPKLKKKGSSVMTPSGPGYVIDNLVLQEMCKVKVVVPGDILEVMKFPLDEVQYISDEEMAKEKAKIKAQPNRKSHNNPYETWDKDEKVTKERKPTNSNRRNNKKRYNSPRPNKSNKPGEDGEKPAPRKSTQSNSTQRKPYNHNRSSNASTNQAVHDKTNDNGNPNQANKGKHSNNNAKPKTNNPNNFNRNRHRKPKPKQNIENKD